MESRDIQWEGWFRPHLVGIGLRRSPHFMPRESRDSKSRQIFTNGPHLCWYRPRLRPAAALLAVVACVACCCNWPLDGRLGLRLSISWSVLFSDLGVDLASKLRRLSMDARGGARFQRSAKEDEVILTSPAGHQLAAVEQLMHYWPVNQLILPELLLMHPRRLQSSPFPALHWEK